LGIVQTYPFNGATNVPLNPSFIMVFDAKVINNTVKSNVSVLDADGNEVKINTRTAKFNQAPEPYGHASIELSGSALKPNSNYQLVLKPSISDEDGVLLNETVVIDFTTGEEVEPTIPLVHPMEELFFKGDAENSTDVVAANTLQDKNKKYAGSYSNQLSYTFAATGGEALFNVIDPTLVVANSASKVGMYVFSDYSFNTLYAKWATEGDIKFTKICVLDYAGWLYQEADMSELPAGVDYQFMGVKLVCGTNLLSSKGAFYIDNLHALYQDPGSAVENVETQVENKAKIIENGYLYILLNGIKYNAQCAVVE
jgi:hypothetical protein